MRVFFQIAVLGLAALAVAGCAVRAPQSSAPQGDLAMPSLPPAGEPSWIAGIKAEALETQFGPPAFVRKDGAAQIWRYDGARCKAFFFLLGNGTDAAVRHVETLPQGHAMAADPDCLASLRHPPVS